jgi:hypothetical protein
VPQVRVREVPQLSFAVWLPQLAPIRVQKATSLSWVQPQTLTVPPPPQVSGVEQAPQSTERLAPQLSGPATELQSLPRRLQKAASVSGTQPGQMLA